MTDQQEITNQHSSGVDYIFLTESGDSNIKSRLGEIAKNDELLKEFINDRRNLFVSERMLNIYQGQRILVGIVLKNDYKLCDVIFDLSNSEKQSVLSNFTWEGQYQVLVSKKNNYLEIHNEEEELSSLINLDDGSFINLVGAYNLNDLKSRLYLFQCSIIIKPQYWNDLLNFDILLKYHKSETLDNEINLMENDTSNSAFFGQLLVMNEVSSSEILSYTVTKPIFIKVPLTISNYFLQESSQILFIEILNIGESSDSIVIHDIFSHNLKLSVNSPLDLPFTLYSNQSLGCSLTRVNNKKSFITNKSLDEKNTEKPSFLPVVIPIFIKWESKRPSSKTILTQFALQINFDQKVRIFNIKSESKPESVDNCKHDTNPNASLQSSSSAKSSYLLSPSSPHISFQSVNSPFTQEINSSSKLNVDENSGNLNNPLEFNNSSCKTLNCNNDPEIESNANFKAICTFDRISKYPGETVYLLIEVFPLDKDKPLNLRVTVEYDQEYPIIPLYVSMPINYFPEYESTSLSTYVYDHPKLLYPLKICNPGIYKCPRIVIYDFETKSNYYIKKLPLLVCESSTKE
ncbi:hypothetical protein OIY81_1695 [Cryptosporidium canis]|nr:hypothetical protein OIY81_1695 [Cryptosporidium canis]